MKKNGKFIRQFYRTINMFLLLNLFVNKKIDPSLTQPAPSATTWPPVGLALCLCSTASKLVGCAAVPPHSPSLAPHLQSRVEHWSRAVQALAGWLQQLFTRSQCPHSVTLLNMKKPPAPQATPQDYQPTRKMVPTTALNILLQLWRSKREGKTKLD